MQNNEETIVTFNYNFGTCKVSNPNLKCKTLAEKQVYILSDLENGDLSVKAYDFMTNTYFAKGIIKKADRYKIDNGEYDFSIVDRDIVLVQLKEDEVISSTPIGTTYVVDSDSGKITALVVGGVVLAIAIGGAIVWFTKNPPAAGVAATETAEVIGGTAAKEVVKHVFDRMAGLMLPLLTGINRADASDLFTQAQSTSPIVIDPILIDLNGDGVKTTAVENGIYFDHENDGFMETSAWVDENDGMFVIDKNNNGTIDNGNEIFGDNYVKTNGSFAKDGFDALEDLDSNNDGIINSQDEQFNNIKILKGDNTLLTLEQAGIQSINLSKSNTNKTDASQT